MKHNAYRQYDILLYELVIFTKQSLKSVITDSDN